MYESTPSPNDLTSHVAEAFKRFPFTFVNRAYCSDSDKKSPANTGFDGTQALRPSQTPHFGFFKHHFRSGISGTLQQLF
jgi:hypothetical protein